MPLNLEIFSGSLSPLLVPMQPGETRHWIPSGTPGIADTISLMEKLVSGEIIQKMVGNFKRESKLREWLGQILNPINGQRPCNSKDYFCYCKKVYERVIQDVLYVYDPYLVEYIEAPSKLLQLRIGDCDSQDILLVAAFESLGFPAQFVTVKADPLHPDEFTHVYTRVKIPGIGWVAADPTMPQKWFGWEPPPSMVRRYWPGSSDEIGMPIDKTPCVQIGSDGTPSDVADGSWVPTGITGLPALSAKEASMSGMSNCFGHDYAQQDWAIEGYPLVVHGLGDYNEGVPGAYPLGMNGLGEDPQIPQGTLEFFQQVYDGTIGKKIVEMVRVWHAANRFITYQMPAGPARDQKLVELNASKAAIDNLSNQYNKLSDATNIALGTLGYPGNVPKAPGLSALGNPVIIGSIIAIVGLAAIAVVIQAFAAATQSTANLIHGLPPTATNAAPPDDSIFGSINKTLGETRDTVKYVAVAFGLLLLYRHRKDIGALFGDLFNTRGDHIDYKPRPKATAYEAS